LRGFNETVHRDFANVLFPYVVSLPFIDVLEVCEVEPSAAETSSS